MKKFSFILLLFIFNNLFSQNCVFSKVDVEVQGIYSDRHSFVYIVSNNTLIKFNEKGDQLASWLPENGELLTDVDVINPFKILVLFGNQNTVKFLDRNLTVLSDEISLDAFGVYGECLISNSMSGGYWLWDQENSKILKLNSEFEFEYEKTLKFDEKQIQTEHCKSDILFKSDTGEINIYNIQSSGIISLSETVENTVSVFNSMFTFFNKDLQAFFGYQKEKFIEMKLQTRFPEGYHFKDAILLKRIICCYDDKALYFIQREDQ